LASSGDNGPEEAQRAADLLLAVYDELRQLAAALVRLFAGPSRSL
jgi:hypothetical protein